MGDQKNRWFQLTGDRDKANEEIQKCIELIGSNIMGATNLLMIKL